MKIFNNETRSPGGDLNPGPSRIRSRVITTPPRRCIINNTEPCLVIGLNFIDYKHCPVLLNSPSLSIGLLLI
jgi:hypothetical protein